MLKKICLTTAILAVVAMPAFAAETCGSTPIPPAVPVAGDLAGKLADDAHALVLDTLKNIKIYQSSLVPYYDCLDRQAKSAQDEMAAAQAKADDGKVTALKQSILDVATVYDKTRASEVQVANEFNTLHVAYCALGTGLKGCAKP